MADDNPPVIGFGKLPRDVTALLEEATDIAVDAARLLLRMAERSGEVELAEVEGCQKRSERVRAELADCLRHTSLSAEDRGELLALGRSVGEAVDAVTTAAHATSTCDCHAGGRAVASVIRDLARAHARAITALEIGRGIDDDVLAEVMSLRREGQHILRRASSEALNAETDPIEGIRVKFCFDRLEGSLRAAVQAALSLEHASAELAR